MRIKEVKLEDREELPEEHKYYNIFGREQSDLVGIELGGHIKSPYFQSTLLFCIHKGINELVDLSHFEDDNLPIRINFFDLKRGAVSFPYYSKDPEIIIKDVVDDLIHEFDIKMSHHIDFGKKIYVSLDILDDSFRPNESIHLFEIQVII